MIEFTHSLYTFLGYAAFGGITYCNGGLGGVMSKFAIKVVPLISFWSFFVL